MRSSRGATGQVAENSVVDMLAACVTHMLPFWPIHPPASAVHTSTSSSPMAGKAFAYSPDCQSRIIANYSFKVSLSESGITKTAPD
jgi:hypothetical protein